MRVLVAHGSERGGTAELASRVAAALREDGLEVDVKPAREVHDVKPYDAVVLGGALYAMHWHRDAQHFVLRHHRALREREVHFFSSGPLDDSASHGDIPPTPQVAELMAYVRARAHVTFGGRLAKDARGFPASAMAKTRSGDWRDWPQVDAWSRALATTLRAPPAPHLAPKKLPSRTAPLALSAFVGVTAIWGGIDLVRANDGPVHGLPVTALAHTPFATFLWPGVILLTLVGLLSCWAAWEQYRREPWASFWSFAAGCSTTIWIVVEMLMIRQFSWLQIAYLTVGLAITAVSWLGIRRLFATFATMQKKDTPRAASHA